MNTLNSYAEFTYDDLCREEEAIADNTELHPSLQHLTENYMATMEQANVISTEFLSFVASSKF